MMYGNLYRKNGSLLWRVQYQIIGFWLYLYFRTIKRQMIDLTNLSKQIIDARTSERLRVANLIEDGIDHSLDTCYNKCEPHIIVEFIRALEDTNNGN